MSKRSRRDNRCTGREQFDQFLGLAGVFDNQRNQVARSARLELDIILVALDLDS